jgi:hypothetical protein
MVGPTALPIEQDHSAGIRRRRRSLTCAFLAAVTIALVPLSTALGADVRTFRLDETFIDQETTEHCGFEVVQHITAVVHEITGDYLPDSQGIRTEEAFGTDPSNPDTDGDGYLDGIEVGNETDPTNPASHPQDAIGQIDKDADFLPDGDELLFWGTDPTDPDTDDDGFLDGIEAILDETDPTDPTSHP